MQVVPGYDWGQRSDRWAGVTSQVVDVGGLRVHHLQAGMDRAGPTHLLLHSMGSGAWSWLDVIGRLAGSVPVIAPDLPGSGRSRPARRGPADAFSSAGFLAELIAALGIERVVVHGHSMGGLVGGLFAGGFPERVERLVLTSAPLPGLPDPPRFPKAWTLGLRAARPAADVVVGAGARWKADTWRRMVVDRDARLGAEVLRMSPELLALAADEIGRLTIRWRVEGAVDMAIAVVRALTVDEARARAALDAITAPTLLLWGADDRVLPRRVISSVEAAHPSWTSRTIDGVGHLLPWAYPDRYVELAA